MFLSFLNDLLKSSQDIDGSLNRLNNYTINLQYIVWTLTNWTKSETGLEQRKNYFEQRKPEIVSRETI